MAQYRIQIDYYTGNSFGNEDCTDTLEMVWNDLSVAKENLARIAEHYRMYCAREDSFTSTKNRDSVLSENKDKPWFVKSEQYDNYESLYQLYLITDKGKPFIMSAFWCGYFEGLYSAEIVSDNSDMKVVFN
jgi:hypothetical protein